MDRALQAHMLPLEAALRALLAARAADDAPNARARRHFGLDHVLGARAAFDQGQARVAGRQRAPTRDGDTALGKLDLGGR